MNDLITFNNPKFGEVRTVEQNGEPWFVGKDVAVILGYTNPSKALTDHVDDEDKLNNETLSSLGQRGGWLINESGLYSLILSSKLPTARAFKRWVTSEVLPSLRKHGLYAADELLNNPDLMIEAMQALKAERAKNQQLNAKVQQDAPKVLFADSVTASQSSFARTAWTSAATACSRGCASTAIWFAAREPTTICRPSAAWNLVCSR